LHVFFFSCLFFSLSETEVCGESDVCFGRVTERETGTIFKYRSTGC